MMRRRGSVLVIDDEPDLRELLDLELSTAGYDVVTAENGLVALAAARKRPFDLALTDLRMPEMDGMATIAALKDLDPGIEIVVITGYPSADAVKECAGRGVFAFVEKPFALADLRGIVERALEHHRRAP